MKVAKKNAKTSKSTKTESKKADKEMSLEEMREKLRIDYTTKGPLRLRKFAVAVLEIKPEVVDKWNDFELMVDCCVAKKLGEPFPDGAEVEEDIYNDTNDSNEEETDTEGSENEESETSNSDDDDDLFGGEMDDSGEDLFAGPDDDGSENTEDDAGAEPEPEPEPEKPKVRKSRKTKKEAPPADISNDVGAQLQGLLDVITNQGIVLDQLKQNMASQTSTLNEIYVRQEASHKAVTAIAKTCFSMSTYISHFVPKALKAMRFNIQVYQHIREKAEDSAKKAESLVKGLLDPEAD